MGVREAGRAQSTERGRPGSPAAATGPGAPSVQEVAVLGVEGKALKKVAQRRKPRQGRKGGLLGGKARGALEWASGLALALATPAAGETNAATRGPARGPQGRPRVAGPRVGVADRQGCDLPQTAAFAPAPAHCVGRSQPTTPVCPAAPRPVQHGEAAPGRRGVEELSGVGF